MKLRILFCVVTLALSGCGNQQDVFQTIESDSGDYVQINDIHCLKFEFSGKAQGLHCEISYTDYIKDGGRVVTRVAGGGGAEIGPEGHIMIVPPDIESGGEVFFSMGGLKSRANVPPVEVASESTGMTHWWNREDFVLQDGQQVVLGVQAISAGTSSGFPVDQSRLEQFVVPYARIWHLKISKGWKVAHSRIAP